MPDDVKALCRRFYSEISAGHLDVVDELIGDDFVDHEDFPGISSDKAGVRQFFELMRSAFPDFQMEVEDMIAEGDRVAARLIMRGTHQGEFMGIPATGREIAIDTIDVVRVVDGRAREHWGVTDTMKMLQQLGVVDGATATSA